MKLKVIKGGKDINGSAYTYVSGCVTNTRLMGVLGLHLHWLDTMAENEPLHIHQFYYYDIEELGLESINIFFFDDQKDALHEEKKAFGGLGASMVSINEAEARHLVKEFEEGTKKKKQPLPEEVDDIRFILDGPDDLDESHIAYLHRRMCADIQSDNGAVNYYLMRVFGKDEEGASYLRMKSVSKEAFEDVSLPRHATFLQNTVESFEDENGKQSYLCESLVESENSYFICVSEIEVERKKIISAKKRSHMPITPQEASLILSRGEFVTVFEIECDMDTFDPEFDEYTLGSTVNQHDTGEMIMQFKNNNYHVEKDIFRLSDDVEAIYYSTDFGQLIMGTYSPMDTFIKEMDLNSVFKEKLRCTGRYHFAKSIIYEFALSGFIDFDDFIQGFE